MAVLANLSREEQLGLGVAAVLHVALVAALVWQVRGEPSPLPKPERIEVTLADDVSLTSTAPDPALQAQAAQAPVLAPEPAPPPPAPEPIPTVDVKPEPRPIVQPVRQLPPKTAVVTKPAVQKPRLTPKAAASTAAPAKPAKPAAKPGGSTRLGADFLSGVSAGERTPARGTPAATFGPAEQASLAQAINRQLKPFWNAPQGVDAELLVTVLSWELNADGSLAGTPQVVSQSGITDSNRPQAKRHAEMAVRAVQRAAPFELPPQFFDKWKRVRSWRFDRKLG